MLRLLMFSIDGERAGDLASGLERLARRHSDVHEAMISDAVDHEQIYLIDVSAVDHILLSAVETRDLERSNYQLRFSSSPFAADFRAVVSEARVTALEVQPILDAVANSRPNCKRFSSTSNRLGVANSGDVNESTDLCHSADYLSLLQLDLQAVRQVSYRLMELEQGGDALDVGFGSSDDVLALSNQVGPEGSVIGLGFSETVVGDARRETRNFPNVNFITSDLQTLPFDDQTFDAVRVERAFAQVGDPQRALNEVCRVARSGARVVVVEPDFDMSGLTCEDAMVARSIKTIMASEKSQSVTASRRLREMLIGAGLTDTVVQAWVITSTDVNESFGALGIDRLLDQPLILQSEDGRRVDRWRQSLANCYDSQRFNALLFGKIANGRRL